MVILIDCEPDPVGSESGPAFFNKASRRAVGTNKIQVQILVRIPEDEQVEYLSKLDELSLSVDRTDDFRDYNQVPRTGEGQYCQQHPLTGQCVWVRSLLCLSVPLPTKSALAPR